MNAHKLEAVLSQDGQLLLNGLPFLAGEIVEVIVLSQTKLQTRNGVDSESQGSATDLLLPATRVSSDQLYLASISNMMEEWESEADEAAYQDL
jgi:hypothetical protein